MQKITILIPLLIFTLASFGQSALPKGQAQLNAGTGKSTWGVPIYIGLDYGMRKNITLGGEISGRRSLGGWKEKAYREDILGLAANGNYHFNTLIGIPSEWDLYIGGNVGYYSFFTTQDGNYGRLGLGGQLGGRYFLNEKTAIHLEFGTGGLDLAGIKLGVTHKLYPKTKKKKAEVKPDNN